MELIEDVEICENCRAREASATFDVDDVETWLCVYCAVSRTADGRPAMRVA